MNLEAIIGATVFSFVGIVMYLVGWSDGRRRGRKDCLGEFKSLKEEVKRWKEAYRLKSSSFDTLADLVAKALAKKHMTTDDNRIYMTAEERHDAGEGNERKRK